MSGTRRRLRFGVGTLLFLMLCLGGYLTGYRWGAHDKQVKIVMGNVYTQVYDVADLIYLDPKANSKFANFDPLIDTVVSTIDTKIWVENGGPEAEIRPFPTNMPLVISAPQPTHEKIAQLLAELREQGGSSQPRAIASTAANSAKAPE